MNESEIVPEEPAPPEPVVHIPAPWRSLTDLALVVAGTTGVLLVLATATSGRTSGATRSARLQWQARQMEMRQVAHEAAAEEADPIVE